ncbi:MAG TPA: RNA methyltransferase, partial [Gemmatimonadales bacterium]|nr:RNA methyltransferase [Gemmatimonadota bacterium]HPF61229.1 RNA methyltransferase [Gemmatimonadales bacterium]
MSLLTTIRDLHRRKARERRGLALAEGIRLVEEMLAAEVPCKGAVISPTLASTPRGAALVQALEAHAVPIEQVTDRELAEVAATDHPQGVVVAYAPRTWTLDDLQVAPGRPLVLLDGVQDPGNVGTIARTAVAFGAAGLVALPGTVDLTNPKVVRAAAGALFRLPHLHADTIGMLHWLQARGVAPWATTMDGTPLADGEGSGSVALVLGNEGAGITPEVLEAATRRVGIPIRAEAESLNVAVAAGILLHRLGGRG